MLDIALRTSDIRHQTSDIRHQTSDIGHLSIDILEFNFKTNAMKGSFNLLQPFIAVLLVLFFNCFQLQAQNVITSGNADKGSGCFFLANENLRLSVVIRDHRIESDTLSGNPAWLSAHGSSPFCLTTDGDFSLNFIWTDWQAPKKSANADNPVMLSKHDFLLTGSRFMNLENGAAELTLSLRGEELPILLEMTYHLDPGAFYAKRKIAVWDTTECVHFLDRVFARNSLFKGFAFSGSKDAASIRAESSGTSQVIQGEVPGGLVMISPFILKKGEFGQPAAVQYTSTGCFFGLEYPASVNTIESTPEGPRISCSQEIGMKVGKAPLESEWVVEALVPTICVKDWFFRYVDDIRVAPARPYSLYNSWYDLRSPEYPRVKPNNVMNEENALNIIRLFKKNMIDKYHISLDAFVLDDGWDVYQSDWVLRKETFPNGLKPLADTLKKMGTSLGLWFGPTGGYSFRMKRVNWMKEHGYEVVGNGRDHAMLCLGGKNYSGLFRKRVTDFVSNEGVAYFKWDGIQFSCSEPDHGHPVGLYSRRAILESVIDKCKAVRAVNPKTYLNISSGTWLSPWWVKYANQIWMQGEDYGYADVPSFSQRDGAMTYKDFVLYDDLVTRDWWFPVSNMMTHGIIKGNLETLGGSDDPSDKFTNDVVFYLGRGVSMYELYISPDLLTDREWEAEGSAIAWAKDRFDILSNTYMTGGDPTKRESYGYVHFKGNRGILSLRNPFITPTKITIHLSPESGLDPGSSSLVLDKVYPYRWISRQLYGSGSTIEIPLEGYETAVFELYPLRDAKEPLVCGIRYDVLPSSGNQYRIRVYDAPLGVSILNPEILEGNGANSLPMTGSSWRPAYLTVKSITHKPTKSGTEITTTIKPDVSIRHYRYAILLKPDKDFAGADFPQFTISADGKEQKVIVEEQKGLWSWVSFVSDTTVSEIKTIVKNKAKTAEWKGKASVYMICQQYQPGKEIILTTREPASSRPMLPKPFPEGISEKTNLLDEFDLSVTEKIKK